MRWSSAVISMVVDRLGRNVSVTGCPLELVPDDELRASEDGPLTIPTELVAAGAPLEDGPPAVVVEDEVDPLAHAPAVTRNKG